MGIRVTCRFFTSLSEWVITFAFLVLCFSSENCNAKDESTKPICNSTCGKISNITYPFRLKDDPKHCGHARYTLSCENSTTLVLDLPSSGKYYVKAINYSTRTIRVLDPGLEKNNCSSMPRNFPLVRLGYPYNKYPYTVFGIPAILYMKCLNPANSSLYIDTAPCLIQPKMYSYIYVQFDSPGYMELIEGCSAESMAYMLDYYNASSDEYIHSVLMNGFDLQVVWPDNLLFPACKGFWSTAWTTNDKCFEHSIPGFFRYLWKLIDGFFGRATVYKEDYPWLPIKGQTIKTRWILLIIIGLLFPARLVVGFPILIAFLIYLWRRRHLSMYSTIEDFLQSGNNFMPIRYSYSDIKKMTGKFKEKLGEGGFGSVFKGKLRSGRFVAIKILGKPKANEQDFISEIATIGRIHHVNVVQLVGYCVEGSKRALVYDFMPNGSLDKFTYPKEGSAPLSCKQMYEISLGVAQGIEYLHQGCEMQILHFDIKPHNILLDKNFNAKVSDFGLAKLYPVDNTVVSLTAARGTMGYIAPELFYKNIGGVSYKADVYSFGMLLMEMASRRKNLNRMVEHSSQMYFPLWIYDQFKEGNELEVGDLTDEEKRIIKKMVVTALWCIQMKPIDRPSMNKVIQMLGGDVESLNMPPRPFLYPQEMPVGNVQNNANPACSNVELTWTLSAR